MRGLVDGPSGPVFVDGSLAAAPAIVAPMPAGRLTRAWGDTSIGGVPHKGLDYGDGKIGSPAVAAHDGRIAHAGPCGGPTPAGHPNAGQPSGGRHCVYVAWDHAGWRWRAVYVHCASHRVVVDQSVSAGEYIAAVGAEGYVFGAHLHFELQVFQAGRWVSIDPLPYIGTEEVDAMTLPRDFKPLPNRTATAPIGVNLRAEPSTAAVSLRRTDGPLPLGPLLGFVDRPDGRWLACWLYAPPSPLGGPGWRLHWARQDVLGGESALSPIESTGAGDRYNTGFQAGHQAGHAAALDSIAARVAELRKK